MKKLFSIIALLICISMIMCSCKLNFGSSTITTSKNADQTQEETDEETEEETEEENTDNGGKKTSSNKSGSKSSGGSKESGNSGESTSPAKPVPGGPGSKCAVIAGGSSLRNRGTFTPPSSLMTTEQYHKELENLLKGATSFTNASSDYMDKLDKLDVKLQEQIVFNTDDVKKCSGTHYYVSSAGDDKNDGKSPEKAWKTIAKVNNTPMKKGDLVTFRRGDSFRGIVAVKSGVTYAAYGTGYKPQILGAFDGKKWKWVKTDKENVWKLDHKFTTSD
ncbi:MAG: hypothetical protein KBS52_05165 [Clostridiales bacterium]|nr:hypothetical protein [Candidatus Equinaster intestinalis]